MNAFVAHQAAKRQADSWPRLSSLAHSLCLKDRLLGRCAVGPFQWHRGQGQDQNEAGAT